MHDADIRDSRHFLTRPRGNEPALWPPPQSSGRLRALDVGAGVGRISRGLLLHVADEVDLCDGCSRFVAQAESQLGGPPRAGVRGRMGSFMCASLQSFVPTARAYELVWLQWCVGYLTDEDLVRLLRDCGRALTPGGLLVVKDNIFERSHLDADERSALVDDLYLVDEEDSSVTRSRSHLRQLVTDSTRSEGLELVACADAALGDAGLQPVITLALRLRGGGRPHSIGRRHIACCALASQLTAPAPTIARAAPPRLIKVTDPQSYSALAYSPPQTSTPPPLLVVLHGAGLNEGPIWNLADPGGEHAGLAPSLLAAGRAPAELVDNFAMVAPYAAGALSFYELPRSRLLSFVDWCCSEAGQAAGCPRVDPRRVFLLGFSDGATTAVELATTRRFAGCVICAYGFTGVLPPAAVERLRHVPTWVFHSQDDAIFSVANSDRLVRSLRQAGNERVRYSRFERDQEGFTGRVRGHSTGITASKDPEVYRWLLSLGPTLLR